MAKAVDPRPFPEVSDQVVQKYKENYFLPPSLVVTKDLVQQHAELEYILTQKMLSSRPEERTRVWSEAYKQLNESLAWWGDDWWGENCNQKLQYQHFLKLIPPGSQVIDIGSGTGTLAQFLTENGRPCVATDIATQRGSLERDGVIWHVTDGIHLDKFERSESYDAVVSTQVIEHLHPDDVFDHFRGALGLLRPGGQYLFNTPHAFFGPADLSRVFSLKRPIFMHLKEYTHRELGALARRAGFADVLAVYVPPLIIRRKYPFILHSRMLFRYLSFIERMAGEVRLPKVALRALLFHGDVFLVVTK